MSINPAAYAGLKVQEGSGRVRHQWLPSPLPPPLYRENSYRIFTFCMDPTGQLRGVWTPGPPRPAIRRWINQKEIFATKLRSCPKFAPNFDVSAWAVKFFAGDSDAPIFLTQFYKSESPSNMCQNSVPIDRATSEIKGPKKERNKDIIDSNK